eukprot:3274087-Amphidinium_carterae.1
MGLTHSGIVQGRQPPLLSTLIWREVQWFAYTNLSHGVTDGTGKPYFGSGFECRDGFVGRRKLGWQAYSLKACCAYLGGGAQNITQNN